MDAPKRVEEENKKKKQKRREIEMTQGKEKEKIPQAPREKELRAWGL